MADSEFRYVMTALWQSGSTPNPIIAELPFTDVNFTQQLNSIGTFQGHVLLSGINSTNLNAYDGTIPGKTILWVLYTDPESATSIPVWSGVIWAREYDSSSQILSIGAQEMMSLYNRRRISTTKNFTNNPLDPNGYDPMFIADDLMKYAEALPHGKTGLTYFTDTSLLRTKKLYEGFELKSVYQAIKDLASNYFDFKIAPYLDGSNLKNRFWVGDPLGTIYTTTALLAPVFQFPGNVVEYKYPEDASGAANKLYGLGYGANNKKVLATAIDNDKIGTLGTWPLLEDTANYVDVGDVKLLKDLTLGQLNAISYPPTTVEIVIPPYIDPTYPLSYKIGDQVRVDIQDDFLTPYLNGEVWRIMAISVNPGENGPSRITLTLTRLLASGSVT
jgi:hypothetical protein